MENKFAMTRRDALKLTTAAVAGLGATSSLSASSPTVPTEGRAVPMWGIAEQSFRGPDSGNPFVDVQFGATYRLGHRTVEVEGFYDGAGVYKVRFMPDTEGQWEYTTRSNVAELNGKQGRFEVVASEKGVHGPVRVADTYHFAYADGTPYQPFGTTCYAWTHQSEALQKETLRTLASAPFNKLRMCIFPKSYEYNHNEPPFYPFVRDSAGKSDFTRLNPEFFAHLEQRVHDLDALGIQADLILFHPYDRWGYSTMPAEDDDRYLRYVLARLSSFRNVWWSMANEYDLMHAKTTQDFDRFFHIVQQYDPYAHLRSIHFSNVMYDYSRPWVTHASLQTTALDKGSEFRSDWRKPVVFDEVQYEGNLNRRWGNISGAELTRRFWLGVIHGCYVTHGETYLEGAAAFDENATPTLWWSHGGTLHGTSPKGIGFLRKLVEEAVAEKGTRLGFDPEAKPYYLNASVMSSDGKHTRTILYYFDDHQPIWYEFPLPAGSFTAETIDPDTQTITPVPGTFSGKAKIRLPVRPYQALRFRAV